jgi:hypothetical protein
MEIKERDARFRADAFAIYEGNFVPNEAGTAIKSIQPDSKGAGTGAAASEKDDEDELEMEEWETYKKKKTKWLRFLLKSAFVCIIVAAIVVFLVIFHIQVYACYYVVGHHGFNETLRKNFTALNTNALQVKSTARRSM